LNSFKLIAYPFYREVDLNQPADLPEGNKVLHNYVYTPISISIHVYIYIEKNNNKVRKFYKQDYVGIEPIT
jgi:hypothetical protein